MEPVYNYVKGAGWVPSIYDVYSGNIGLYKVTISNEPPVHGDYYAYGKGTTPQKLFEEAASTKYNLYFQVDPPQLSKFAGRSYWLTETDELFSVRLEKL